jgi:uncharacterized protein (DUF433 family)
MVNISEAHDLDEATLTDDGSGDPDGGGEPSFDGFAAMLLHELAPRNVLERVLAERVVLSAWTLQLVAEKELVAIGNPFPGSPCDESLKRRRMRHAAVDVSPQGVQLTAQTLAQTLQMFRSLRTEPPLGDAEPASRGTDVTLVSEIDSDLDNGPVTIFDFDHELDDDHLADLSNEWPVVPRGRRVEDDGDPEVEARPARDGDREATLRAEDLLAERWRGRLVFDFSVSEDSPVIHGTWVTVAQVVSLIVDGWTWSDILRAHPELTEDDIRICLAYTVAEERGDL